VSAGHTPGPALNSPLSRWGMFKVPQGSIVTCCFAHAARCTSMLNWRPPSSPACGAYANDECDMFGAAIAKAGSPS
jgi:hypothetical protein